MENVALEMEALWYLVKSAIMMMFFTKFSPVPCYFLPLQPQYPPHNIFPNTQPLFTPYEGPSSIPI